MNMLAANEKQKRRLFLWLREWMLNRYAAFLIIPDAITLVGAFRNNTQTPKGLCGNRDISLGHSITFPRFPLERNARIERNGRRKPFRGTNAARTPTVT